MAPPQDLLEKLTKLGQQHVLAFWDELTPAQQTALVEDIKSANVENVNKVFSESSLSAEGLQQWTFSPPSKAVWTDAHTPSTKPGDACILTRLSEVPSAIRDDWHKRGLELIADQKVGAVIMAGGQGTRLGWHQAKGTFPIGPVSNHTLFQILAERHLAACRLAQHGSHLDHLPQAPLYVMTADHNHEESCEFFKKNNYFGLSEKNVTFFRQQTLPCLSTDGKILLETKSSLARAPNGNGGIFESLKDAGILEDMKKRGLIGIHVFGIDNALIKVLDPTFIGYVDICGAPVGNKCAFKTNPDEKVGMMCKRRPTTSNDSKDDSCCVVEYVELSPEMRNKRISDEPGAPLTLSAGSICNHFFRLDFVEALLSGSNTKANYFAHIAHKKIPHVNVDTGKMEEPATPNGVKLEYFIFDSFVAASSVVGLEVAREADFSPVKNASGEDSPESCRKMMDTLYKEWAKKAGWTLSGDGFLEISPLISYEGEDLKRDVSVTLPAYIK